MSDFRPGKINHELLQTMLSKYTHRGKGLIVGPKPGEDAAVLDIGGKYVAVATDPVTYTTDRIGWYSVQINANDIACLGGVPQYFLAVLLLPEGETSEELVEEVFSDIDKACQALGVVLIGGHTEVTPGLDRVVVCGEMIGAVGRENLVTSSGARPGDAIILTKGIAIEGTSIIAREKERELKSKYGEEFLQRARVFLEDPGISVVEMALVANRTAKLTSLHDPTEGGLATGLGEVAAASEVGVEIEYERIPIFPETKMLCEEYGLDPLGLIASGALIITCSPEECGKVEEAFSREGIPHSLIGRVTDHGLWMVKGGEKTELPHFPSDELTRLL